MAALPLKVQEAQTSLVVLLLTDQVVHLSMVRVALLSMVRVALLLLYLAVPLSQERLLLPPHPQRLLRSEGILNLSLIHI